MNLCIDIGNSAVKAGLFSNGELMSFICHRTISECLADIADSVALDGCIVSSTVGYSTELRNAIKDIYRDAVYLTSETPIPLKNRYHTPSTLGSDRLAASVGAYHQTNTDTLVIDSGTAITYDLVSANGEYLGGNISPGADMRFQALHEQTAKLPLVDADGPLPDHGYDTDTAIRCGVINGIRYEIEHYISIMILKYPNLSVFFTGGTNIDFDKSIKKRIFADRYLVLKGLNLILDFQKRIQ